MTKQESESDRNKSKRSSSKSGTTTNTSSSSSASAPAKRPAPTSSGDRLRPPVFVTSLNRKNEELRQEKNRELAIAAKVAIDYEENEAATRDAASDMASFTENCETIRDSLGRLKMDSEMGETAKELLKIQIVASFTELKILNRLDKLRLKAARDSVNQVKQTVDNYYLQLQNLLSEIMYIQKEITRCLEYKSRADDVDLVALEQFYAEAPSEISQPDNTMGDEHHQTMARLEWELHQRRDLTAALEKHDLIKQQNLSAVDRAQDSLSQLRPLLAKVLESLNPICGELDIKPPKTQENLSATNLVTFE